jgi:thiol-disulfide isomerase/thioredoxin
LDHPLLFSELNMLEMSSSNHEAIISQAGRKIFFFWGNNCPNCDLAKRIIQENISEYKNLNFQWYHANLYRDFELAKAFGVHGIPVFFLYINEKKIGKITSFPGHDQFMEVLSKFNDR